jgi:hypothetical protein
MSSKVSVGKGSSENLRQADRGNGKNIFQRVETAGMVSGGLGMGGVSNIGSVGGANSKGKLNGRNIFQRAEMAGMVVGNLGTGSVLNVGSVGNNVLRCSDEGICFVAEAEMAGRDGRQGKDSKGTMGNVGEAHNSAYMVNVVVKAHMQFCLLCCESPYGPTK